MIPQYRFIVSFDDTQCGSAETKWRNHETVSAVIKEALEKEFQFAEFYGFEDVFVIPELHPIPPAEQELLYAIRQIFTPLVKSNAPVRDRPASKVMSDVEDCIKKAAMLSTKLSALRDAFDKLEANDPGAAEDNPYIRNVIDQVRALL